MYYIFYSLGKHMHHCLLSQSSSKFKICCLIKNSKRVSQFVLFLRLPNCCSRTHSGSFTYFFLLLFIWMLASLNFPRLSMGVLYLCLEIGRVVIPRLWPSRGLASHGLVSSDPGSDVIGTIWSSPGGGKVMPSNEARATIYLRLYYSAYWLCLRYTMHNGLWNTSFHLVIYRA